MTHPTHAMLDAQKTTDLHGTVRVYTKCLKKFSRKFELVKEEMKEYKKEINKKEG